MLRLLILLLCGAAGAAQAAHTQARLALANETARPGQSVLAGIELRMDPGWHTYWKNPGASGMATTVKWDLPAEISAGEIEWPVPEKLPPDDLVTYVYENEVVLLVPLKLAPDLKPGIYPIKAKLSWLECSLSCIPGKADVTATLTVGDATKTSADAGRIEQWQKKLPQPGDKVAARAWWEKTGKDNVRSLVIEWNSPTAASEADFYPQTSNDFEVQGATERLVADSGKIRIRKDVRKLQGDWPKQIAGLLIQKTGNDRTAYDAALAILSNGPSIAGTQNPVAAQPLWRMLLYAFIGGLILNVMPCVLPVIALKIVGFVTESKNDPRHVRSLGLVYGLGVLVSFLVLAAGVILIQAAGHKAAWGMQFNSPYFLLAMTVLVTLIALNLFGLFEVSIGGRALDTAAALSSRSGWAGAFFNGLLATVLATSCTAPFLGAAVGFAFAQPPAVVVLIMLMVGVGLAAPYVVLSWQPAWMKFLPKPGAWMEKFKIAMGFPMLAAGVWLCSLLSTYYGDRTWAMVIFLVFVAVAAWIYGEFVQRGRRRRLLAAGLAAVVLVAGYTYALEGELQWRNPSQSVGAPELSGVSPSGSEWQKWTPAAVAAAQAEGRPVLVDFTAKWCLTCQKNVKPVLGSHSVRSKMEQLKAVGFVGDYTRFPADITDELNRFGRAGVPLVLVFPGKPGAAPIILPEALTARMVTDALDRAASGENS